MGGILPLEQFMCWKLKTATIAYACFTIGAAAIAMMLEILDIISLGVDDFDIPGGFKATWRAHVWEGWLACNVVMVFTHTLMISYSVIMIFAVKRFPTYYEFSLTKGYLAMIIIYIIVEFGVTLYRYSWYAGNTFRLPYLVFTFMFWIIRTIFNIMGCLIAHSRISEINYEITYGEKKNIDPYSSRSALIASAVQSGTATPVPRGPRTASQASQPWAGPSQSTSYA